MKGCLLNDYSLTAVQGKCIESSEMPMGAVYPYSRGSGLPRGLEEGLQRVVKEST